MRLFVGLGNPGEKHARNRHNVGFMAVERIAEKHRFQQWRRRFQGETAEGAIGGERVLLLKPLTYMNESGRAVGEAARFLKIDLSDIIVFHDEIDLVPGKVKIKTGGGNAGHNGLRSISAHLGNDFARVRIGVGHPGAKDAVVHYVLHDFAKADQEWLEPLLDALADAAGRLAAGDAARFLTDVAQAMHESDRAPPVAEQTAAKPTEKPRPHPAGERMQKRQSALAENLKRWLAGRSKP
ncbi:MAG: aminoacyl-tRNA hydrolase [Hyphomicrobiaceae bacterium]|nr:aminoacyl-tRNA hydrolase [Hyphomicrobiaceae bacterium]